MEKRHIIFIIASFFLIMAWDYYAKSQRSDTNVFSNKSGMAKENKPPVIEKQLTQQTEAATTTTLPTMQMEYETNLFKFSVVKESGFFNKILLKNYYTKKDQKSAVDIFRNNLFNVYDSLYVMQEGVRIIYKNVAVQETEKEIRFKFTASHNNIGIIKTISVNKNTYMSKISYDVINNTNEKKSVAIATVISQQAKDFEEEAGEGRPTPYYFYEGAIVPSKKKLEKGFKAEIISFGGQSEKYFSLFFVDPLKRTTVDATLRNDKIDSILSFYEGEIQGNKTLNIDLELFTGPKDPAALKNSGHDLIKSIDYGFFHFIAKPMLISLNFFNSFAKNYGISIIILTIIIKILFFPLSHKSYKSMKELQKLQPMMEQLRTKYAKDKEALNREMMLMYKTHGVNPLGGCLPMLVQIPFFIALYQALMNAIELRHAPFAFWIQDLSAYDPYYVTPILMGASMLIQQFLTPSSGDPVQKNMMYLLPVIFTVMFLKLPAGLLLYWLVNNVFSLVQQLITMKTRTA